MKKALSLLLVLALALAIFALPAAAETHDHDGCADCAAESVILRRPPVGQIICSWCECVCNYVGMDKTQYIYQCPKCSRYYYFNK